MGWWILRFYMGEKENQILFDTENNTAKYKEIIVVSAT